MYVWLLAILQLSFAGQALSANTQPIVVPSLKSWTGGNGDFTIKPGARIVVSSNYKQENDKNSRMENPADLRQVAGVLANDIITLSSLSLKVVTGNPTHGDVYLQLDQNANQTSDEAYSMKVRSSLYNIRLNVIFRERQFNSNLIFILFRSAKVPSLCLGKPPEESTMAQGLSCKL
jgi:hypothetical protein